MSFRTRLFVSIVATVMTVLAGVLVVAWTRVLDVEASRLNDGLCSEASRVAMEHFPANELASLEADIVRKLRVGENRNVLVRYEELSGSTVYQSAQWNAVIASSHQDWQVLFMDASGRQEQSRSVQTPPQARCALRALQREGRVWQVARVVEDNAAGWVAANLEAPSQEIRSKLLQSMRVVVPVAVLLAALAAWALSVYLVRPLNRLGESMKAVSPQDLGVRLNSDGEDREFNALITSYNTMLARLERSFHQASRFSADAAHELKTPLTVLLGSIERLRRTVKDPELHAKLSQLLEEVSRLASITRKLLLLSQADAGKLELNLVDVDLSVVLNELMGDALMASESRSVRFEIEDGLRAQGDAVLLRQLFNNVIGNALRYADADGTVAVKARRVHSSIQIDVFNTCPAVSPAERERFFERFYRGQDAQARGMEGSGLGLSLVQEIARAHHGSVSLMPSAATEVLLVVNLPAL